jgi:HPr kinase/phosphorylase
MSARVAATPVARSRAHATSVHGTCVAFGARGVLIRGRSGSGKSDLALRLVADGARLVADDQVLIGKTGRDLVARAPKTIRGVMEVRGVGIVRVPTSASARLRLVVDLVPSHAVPRLPDPHWEEIAGVRVPSVALASFEASAPLKVRLALRSGGGVVDASEKHPRSRNQGSTHASRR